MIDIIWTIDVNDTGGFWNAVLRITDAPVVTVDDYFFNEASEISMHAWENLMLSDQRYTVTKMVSEAMDSDTLRRVGRERSLL